MAFSNGWSRAPMADCITSHTSRVLWACSSSINAADGLRPSRLSALAGRGLYQPSSGRKLIASWFLPSHTRKTLPIFWLCRIQRLTLENAGLNTAMAWSRVVAMVYTSAPCSPSMVSR